MARSGIDDYINNKHSKINTPPIYVKMIKMDVFTKKLYDTSPKKTIIELSYSRRWNDITPIDQYKHIKRS